MTTQANDGVKKSWVLSGEQPLTDVVCATFGWLEEASQSLEYGKNYEGYWNGELFVKQVCRINNYIHVCSRGFKK